MCTWPDVFPEGVPPSSATDADGVAYRIVRTIPANPVDFRSTWDEQPKRRATFAGEDLVHAHGCSLHRELADSVRTRDKFPALRTRRIARGELEASHGVVEPTRGQSHITLWMYVEARPDTAFFADAEGE